MSERQAAMTAWRHCEDVSPGLRSSRGSCPKTSTRKALLGQDIDLRQLNTWLALPYQGGGEWRLFEVLTDAGILAGSAAAPQLTALVRWLASLWRALAPVQIAPERPLCESAQQLLAAAAGTDAATRDVAVRLVTDYGEKALPAWHDVLDSDDLGPHARLGPRSSARPSPGTARWSTRRSRTTTASRSPTRS